jgi:hypothetical protein
LYVGEAQANVVENLGRHGIIEVVGDNIRVLDPDRYLTWLERAYRQHGGSHLNPLVRAAIERYIASPRSGRGANIVTGRGSFGGFLPGTHAEILAVNDVLEAGGSAPNVATIFSQFGDHFIACVHCGGILDELAPAVPGLRVWTGRAIPTP